MDLSPPPPSPPPGFRLPTLHPTGSNNSFPVIAIAVIGILATAFLLISYYIFVIKCCLTWHRVDIFNRFFSRVRDPADDSTADNAVSIDGTVATSKGLDEALIRSIPVIEFRKLDKIRQFNNDVDTDTDTDSTAAAARRLRAAAAEQTASYECAVCLSEFEEGERLRVIPYCCHAFHIDCIDIWLQSNANCPLCRSGISPDSILYNTQHLPSYPPPAVANADESQHRKGTPDNHVNESEQEEEEDDDDGYVVIEIRGNNLDEPRLVRREPSQERKKLGHVSSMGDELIDMRNKDDDDDDYEFYGIQPIRRSVSMDLSSEREFCLEIQQCYRKNDDKSCSSSSSSNCSSNKVRRSIFSFGHSRGSRCSVQPVHLDA